MNSITTQVYGDIHIQVTPASMCQPIKTKNKPCGNSSALEDAAEVDGYQELVQSMEAFLNETADEYDAFHRGVEDGDIDSIVMVLYPGKPPKIMTESECYELVERYGNFCTAMTIDDPDICADGLKAVYDPRTVLLLGNERYLIGPVIVYASEDSGDSISLDAQKVMAAIVHFTGRTVALCADGKDLPAYRM